MSLRERVQKEDDHLFPRLVWTMFPWFPSSKKNLKGHFTIVARYPKKGSKSSQRLISLSFLMFSIETLQMSDNCSQENQQTTLSLLLGAPVHHHKK
jgi:hypothetical protein